MTKLRQWSKPFSIILSSFNLLRYSFVCNPSEIFHYFDYNICFFITTFSFFYVVSFFYNSAFFIYFKTCNIKTGGNHMISTGFYIVLLIPLFYYDNYIVFYIQSCQQHSQPQLLQVQLTPPSIGPFLMPDLP